jgi:hypothetical protein
MAKTINGKAENNMGSIKSIELLLKMSATTRLDIRTTVPCVARRVQGCLTGEELLCTGKGIKQVSHFFET